VSLAETLSLCLDSVADLSGSKTAAGGRSNPG